MRYLIPHTNTNLITIILDNNNLVQTLAATDDKIGTWNDFVAHQYMPSLRSGMTGTQCPTKKELTTFIDTYGSNVNYTISGTYADTQLVKDVALSTSLATPTYRGNVYLSVSGVDNISWTCDIIQGSNYVHAYSSSYQTFYTFDYNYENMTDNWLHVSVECYGGESMNVLLQSISGPWQTEPQQGSYGPYAYNWQMRPSGPNWAIQIIITA